MSAGRFVRFTPIELTPAQKRRLRDVPRGELHDAETGELLIMATRAHIEWAIRERGYVVVQR